MKKNLVLFWEMFKISLFVVGGGFAILAVADTVFSRKLKWTEEGEIASRLPVFQMVPGIIAGDTAIYVGRKIGGLPGALCAIAGVVIPSVCVFAAVSAMYARIPLENPVLDAVFSSLRGFVAGVVGAMAFRTFKSSIVSARAFAVMSLALAAISFFRVNPAAVVAVAATAGLAFSFLPERGSGTRRLFSSFWAIPLIFLKYGAVAFGGGYVLVPVYVSDFVGDCARFLHLTGEEFANVMALTQMTPGPISVNCATFFGFRMGVADGCSAAASVAYSLAATLSLLLPGVVALYLLLGSIDRFGSSPRVKGILGFVKPVTAAMMLNATWTFATMSFMPLSEGRVPFAAVPFAAAVFGAASIIMRFSRIVLAMAVLAAVSAALFFAGVKGPLFF